MYILLLILVVVAFVVYFGLKWYNESTDQMIADVFEVLNTAKDDKKE